MIIEPVQPTAPERMSFPASTVRRPDHVRVIASAIVSPLVASIAVFVAEIAFTMATYRATIPYGGSGLPSAHDVRFWLPRMLEGSAYTYVVCAICLAPIAIAAIFVPYRAFVVTGSALFCGVAATFVAYATLPVGHGGANINVDALLLGATLVGLFIGAVVGFVFCLIARVGNRVPQARD